MTGWEVFDLTIIGGGPAGLYSAFYGGLRGMKTKIIEAQAELGGKIHVYPEKVIWDVGGLGPITGAELIGQLSLQALTFSPEVVQNEKIVRISKNSDGIFVLESAAGTTHLSKTVIVAIGSGILRPQKLAFEGADRFETANLHYTVQSIKTFADRTVIISGGGNSAVDWANMLEPVAKKVYLTYRKESLSGHESQVSQLMDSSAEIFLETSITRLMGCVKNLTIEKVELTNHRTGEITVLPVDEVLVNHGFDRDSSLLENSGLDISLLDGFYIEGTAASETSVPGLFAAGDILKHDGKLNLIAGAFQDAANAVNKAKQYIQPDADTRGMVSSHNDRFRERNQKLLQKMIQ
ncbi:NAD(P)/FAD-dependent oxidoreductase [Mesobacillus zeae]|uniref:Ferredoxin--NADP reductase n=1 Tax=Mesobacillus zeae TaxID=1917180 RepID=A0A398B3F5_9BACI|nr:NAD(P)/FAD-dependent oxidoreductase [Mesobacillus zeae]RID82480.1 NAD(P)/FAD-dependent oxidoreductase [Mesobacillus zeae]